MSPELDQSSPIESSTATDHYIASLTILALLLRVGIAILIARAEPVSWFYSQASELGEVAHSVAIGAGLASPFGGNTGPSAFLPPGYPLFVGLLFKLLGSYSRGAEVTLLLLQACFGATAVLLLMLVARRYFGRAVALIAGLILALHPWLISLGFVFWETSLSLMLLMGLIFVTTLWIEQPSPALGIFCAVSGAFAIAVNASLTLTALGLFGWAAYVRRDHLRAIILPAICFIALCSLWPARNMLEMHAFIPLRDNLGYELWQGNRNGGDGFFAPELHPNNNSAELQQFKALGELNYMRSKSAIAKQAISTDPGRFVWLTGKRVLCFWLGISRQTFRNQIFIATLSSVFGLLGLLLYARDSGWSKAMPLLIPLLFFPIPYYITHPDFRFWCLLAPLLTSFAVYTLRRRRAFVLA